MQPAIHSDRLGQVDAIGATPMSSQNAASASLTGFAKTKAEMNTKMSKIRGLYGSKEKNLTGMVSWTALTKLFALMKDATRQRGDGGAKGPSCCSGKQTTRLEEVARKLKRIAEKTINTAEKNIWAKVAFKSAEVAFSVSSVLAASAPPKRRLSKEMELVAWIKGDQEMKRVQKMSAAEVVALARGPDTVNTLPARKNIVEVRRFKRLVVFKIVSEGSKKILKSNDFWIKDVVITATLRREKFGVMIHEVRVKSMPQDIKNGGAKVIEKAGEVMHSELQIESVE